MSLPLSATRDYAFTRRRFLQAASLAASSFWSASFASASFSEFNVGITTNTLGGWEKDLIKSFREAAEVGYRAVETFYSYVLLYWEKPKEMKMILAEFGLRFVTVSNGGRSSKRRQSGVSRFAGVSLGRLAPSGAVV